MSVPFDTSTIFGWYMKWLLQVWGGFVYNTSIPALVPYFVCCCFYVGACCKHFEINYKQYNANIERYRGGQGKRMKRNDAEKIENEFQIQFNHLVHFHVRIMR